MTRLLIVYFGPFDVNSAIQAFHFANELTDEGWEVTMCGRENPARMSAVGEPRFACISHQELDAELRRCKQDPKETIVFAWTPRERVRRLTERAVAELGAPYVVHLEDNEYYLLESVTGRSMQELQRLPLAEQDSLIQVDNSIHPTNHLEFMRGAAGVTVITEALNEFNVGNRPHRVARPGIDPERFRPGLRPPVARGEIGLSEEDFVIVYHGTIHYANQHEMLSLYLAVKLLQRRGHRVRLVRLGHTEFGGPDPASFRAIADGAVELGPVAWREIPGYLALADAFVQPGPPDDFNRYRLPSKLPEFLAMGKPVILPHCNIGDDLVHGENALLLEEGNAMEIAMRIEDLLADPALAERLGQGSRRFALEQLSWQDNAAGLGRFFLETMAQAPTASRAS
jgi:glycosyltransferase involved in cell wall biosynthesis